MGQRPPVRGFFEGTAHTIYVCLGAVPSRFEVWGLEAATPDRLLWDKYMMHGVLTSEGVAFLGTDGTMVDLINDAGIAPYLGGEVMTTTNQQSVTYGDGYYIEADDKDYRFFTNSNAGISGDASTTDIIDWTLTTAASYAGKFNGNVVGTYIGEGSLIRVKEANGKTEQTAAIITCAAGAGSTAGDVVLSAPLPTGKVTFIGGRYGFKPVTIGKTTTPGVKISDVTYCNVSNEVAAFIAYFD